jgi:hypothetical protein
MGGLIVQDERGNQFRLSPDELAKFLDRGWIDIHSIDSAQIHDRDKGDGLTKAIASVQIMWFLLQLIGRAATKLSITTLELFTLAYVVCALSTYFLWWDKPKDVTIAHIVSASPAFTTKDYENLHSRNSDISNELSVDENFNFYDRWDTPKMFVVAALFCFLFGACHILGWNAMFPTSVERLLWRIGSIGCVSLPMLMLFFTGENAWLPKKLEKLLDGYLLPFIAVCYFVVRVFLFFEVFFSLRKVPADVYLDVPWSQYFPHI